MESIWKFPIKIVDEQVILMPRGAEILAVQVQDDHPCLWARVQTTASLEARKIVTHGTGHEVLPCAGSHLGTYQLDAGNLVFHVFEST